MSAERQTPDIMLERYRLQELPEHDAARLRELAARNPQIRARIDALERSDAEFTARDLMSRMETGVRARMARLNRAQGSGLRALWAVPVVMAAAALIFAVVPRGVIRPDPGVAGPATADTGDRIKGLRPALALYRRTADGSETLADGAAAHRGDLIRIGYRAAGQPYGVILSVDGRGSVTVHLPAGATRAVPLRRDATVLLDQAYELDDAPLWERFYFITGHEPFPVAPLLDAARRIAADRGSQAAALQLPPGLEQSSFSIQKETTP